ncbi:hypothetical protein N231_01025 [Geobacillus stearothermophilus ATCC 12980]|nr:hypothetical protein AA906_04205 [Geobacillus stearothermophilus]KMY62176.1 hypothetical protein AA904_06090 [Geobacillus stearothermophilus]KMY63677.1 hypothetical protein AA905_05220 [Geobacillus stearothermophilus]KOR95514.1 hypothetical protein N231_01025 [Geobacillus stearothermophilus ATCC 12980]
MIKLSAKFGIGRNVGEQDEKRDHHRGGTSLLKLLHEASGFDVVAVIDVDDNAPGLQLARKWGIAVGRDWRPWMDEPLDLIIETTGRADVLELIRQQAPKGANIVPSAVARMMAELV